MQPLVIGNPENEVLPTHPLYNIPPKSVIKAYVYAQDHTKENADELIGSKQESECETPSCSKSQSMERDQDGMKPQVPVEESEIDDQDDAIIEEDGLSETSEVKSTEDRSNSMDVQ